jgi:hypothetical protein
MRTKTLTVILAAAAFALTVAFLLIFMTDDVKNDEQKAFTYSLIFMVAFIALNAAILYIGITASRKLKAMAGTKNCPVCGSAIAASARSCPRCRAMQPVMPDDNIYLDPKEQEADDTVRPKK